MLVLVVMLHFLIVIPVCLNVVDLLVVTVVVCGCCGFGLVFGVLCWVWMLLHVFGLRSGVCVIWVVVAGLGCG